jgi:hypothetical protein
MSVVNYVCINVEVTDIFLTLNPKPSSTDVFDDTSMVTLLHLDIQHSRSRKSSPAPLDEVWLVGERARARERATGRVRGRMCEGGRRVVGGRVVCGVLLCAHDRDLHALRHPRTHSPLPSCTFTDIRMYKRSTCVLWHAHYIHIYICIYARARTHTHTHTHTNTYTLYVC